MKKQAKQRLINITLIPKEKIHRSLVYFLCKDLNSKMELGKMEPFTMQKAAKHTIALSN
jgi:hypothetical protein